VLSHLLAVITTQPGILSSSCGGKIQHKTEGKIRYYHYHDTISRRGEPYRKFVKPSTRNNGTWLGGTLYVYDGTINTLAPSIKQFEKRMSTHN
jgi:hypothetical protein